MNDLFANPYWHSLLTEHANITIGSSTARRFPADVIPFAGAPAWDEASLTSLRDLLAPNESIIITGESIPTIPGLEPTLDLPGWQMHPTSPLPEPPPGTTPTIRELHAPDAPAMVALTDVAFPGYFRPRTYILGRYFGIELDGQLIAMAGERLALPGYREISAVCTHPAHTGKGYAATLIQHLMRVHAAAGLHSFLHVSQSNQRAIALYERLGYTITRPIYFHGYRRTQLLHKLADTVGKTFLLSLSSPNPSREGHHVQHLHPAPKLPQDRQPGSHRCPRHRRLRAARKLAGAG